MNESTSTIVVGLDGNEPADRALDFAIAMAREYRWSLLVTTVVDWHAGMLFPEAAPVVPALDAEWFERAEQDMLASARRRLIDPARAKAEAAGVAVTGKVAFGAPAEEIAELVRQVGAKALVVGRSGKRGLRQPLFGGVAARLLQTSEAPVVVVP